MPLVDSTYRAPRWLPGGQLQTIWPARLVPLPPVSYRRERWPTPDGDFIDVDFALPQPAEAGAPLLALFHGLEGDSGSHYARATMRHFADLGWRAMVVHFRGCSGEPNLMLRAYHSGDSEEGDWVLRTIRQRWPIARLHAVGVSLGGNMLAKWLGERGEDAGFVTARRSELPIDAEPRADVVEAVVAFAVEIQDHRLFLKIRDQDALRHLYAIRK